MAAFNISTVCKLALSVSAAAMMSVSALAQASLSSQNAAQEPIEHTSLQAVQSETQDGANPPSDRDDDADMPEEEAVSDDGLDLDEALDVDRDPDGDGLLTPLWSLEDPDQDDSPRQGLSSQPGSVAVLRGLDKVTARTRDFEAPVGEAVTFGALEITVRYCRKRPPEETPETFVFMEVGDRRTDGFGVEADNELIFSGWMFASNPALNALEHPVYDVWVMDCRA